MEVCWHKLNTRKVTEIQMNYPINGRAQQSLPGSEEADENCHTISTIFILLCT